MNRTITKNIKDPWGLFWLSLSLAGYFLFLNIVWYTKGGISEREEFIIFIQGWLTVPILALCCAAFMEKVRQEYFRDISYFYPFLVFGHVIFWLSGILILRFNGIGGQEGMSIFNGLQLLDRQIPDWKTGIWQEATTPESVYYGIASLFLIVNLVFLGALHLLGAAPKSDYTSKKISDMIYQVIPLGVALILLNFSGVTSNRFTYLMAAIGLSPVSFGHQQMLGVQLSKTCRNFFNAAVFVAILFLVFDPSFSGDAHHQNHYLGPTADLKGGKALLVDINCQYGVMPIYFLKEAFRVFPFSYQGFALLSGVLLMAQYLLVFVLMRFLVGSYLFSAFLLFLIILVNFFASLGHAAEYPSTGPLRFGLPYILLVVSLLFRAENAKKIRLWFWEGLVVAVASVWSFETFVYTLAAYALLLTFDFVVERNNFQERIKSLFSRLGIAVFLGAAVHLWLAWDIFKRSGQWPRWDYYFDYIFLYSTEGFGALPIAPWTPWLLCILVPIASLFLLLYYIGFQNSQKDFGPLRLVAGLTGLAIGQFTYFLGRSHPNNLFHIAIPVVMIFAFWMVNLFKESDTRWAPRRSFLFAGYFALFFLLVNAWPQTIEKIQSKLRDYRNLSATFHSLLLRTPSNEKTAEALALVKKYAEGQKQIAIFISADDSTEVLVLSGKTHIYPYNYILQEGTLQTAKTRLLSFQPPLKEGDIIFVSFDYSDLQARLVFDLQKRFRFIPIEKTPHNILAVRLKAL